MIQVYVKCKYGAFSPICVSSISPTSLQYKVTPVECFMIEVDAMQYQIHLSLSTMINNFGDKFSSAKVISVKIKVLILYIRYRPPSDFVVGLWVSFQSCKCKFSASSLMALKRNFSDGTYWVVMHEMGCLQHPSQIPCFGDLSLPMTRGSFLSCLFISNIIHGMYCIHSVTPEQYCYWPIKLFSWNEWSTICQKTTLQQSHDWWLHFNGNFVNMLFKQELVKTIWNSLSTVDPNQEWSKREKGDVFYEVFHEILW